jgi:hypothetical protein
MMYDKEWASDASGWFRRERMVMRECGLGGWRWKGERAGRSACAPVQVSESGIDEGEKFNSVDRCREP